MLRLALRRLPTAAQVLLSWALLLASAAGLTVGRASARAEASSSVARILRSDSPQSEIRRVLQAHRAETAARGPPPARELQRQLRLALGQVNAQEAAPLDVTDPAILDKTTLALNQLITETHWEIDQKVEECRVLPVELGDEAASATADVQEIAAEESSGRAELLYAVEEYPEDQKNFRALEDEVLEERRDCSKEAHEHLVQAQELAADRDSVHQLEEMLKKYCSAGAFAQVSAVAEAARAAAAGSSRRSWSSLLQVAAEAEHSYRGLRLGGMRARKPSDFCPELSDHLSTLRGEIEDDVAELEAERREDRQLCEMHAENDRREMERTARRKGDLSAEMSLAAGRVNLLRERINTLDASRRSLREQARFARNTCRNQLQELLHQKLCGLVRLRDQLWLRAGKVDMPHDCQVTEWAPGECSASCGGGNQKASRVVILPAWHGAECPPLQMQRRCNEGPCQVNCVVSLWTGWAACSSSCDGGIQERTRVVTTKERYGGDPCPQLIEMRTCNSRACNRNCDLSDWTGWSLCSRACDGGTQRRQRHVEHPPEGVGTCPAEDAEQRLELRPCNVRACPDYHTSKCSGPPVDAVFIVDSSGSMGKHGFEIVQKFLAALAPRFAMGADATKLALIEYADMATVVTGFDGSSASFAAKVSAMQWLRGDSMLSRALAVTDSFLSESSRPEAAPTIVVFTDGLFADPFLSSQQAARLRGLGIRVMFVVLGRVRSNLDLFGEFVTKPSRENLILVGGLNKLQANMSGVASEVLTRVCGEVVVA